MRSLDDVVRLAVIKGGSDAAVSWYLITSYLYYIESTSVISDQLYDELCEILLAGYEGITHPHFRLLDPTALAAATGYYLHEWDYPQIVRQCALRAQQAQDDFAIKAAMLSELTQDDTPRYRCE